MYFFYPSTAEKRAWKMDSDADWDRLRDVVLAGLEIAEAELSERPAGDFVPVRRPLTDQELTAAGLHASGSAPAAGYQYWRGTHGERTLANVERHLAAITGDYVPADIRATHRFWKTEMVREVDARFGWRAEACAYVVETAFLDEDRALYRAFELRRESRPYR